MPTLSSVFKAGGVSGEAPSHAPTGAGPTVQIGNTALQRGDLAKAGRFLQQVPKRLVDGGRAVNSREVIEVSLKLAGVFYSSAKMDKAASGYTWCARSAVGRLPLELRPTSAALRQQLGNLGPPALDLQSCTSHRQQPGCPRNPVVLAGRFAHGCAEGVLGAARHLGRR